MPGSRKKRFAKNFNVIAKQGATKYGLTYSDCRKDDESNAVDYDDKPTSDNVKDELLQLGIFHDDNYDYLHHLKELDHCQAGGLVPVARLDSSLSDKLIPASENELSDNGQVEIFHIKAPTASTSFDFSTPQTGCDEDVVSALDENVDDSCDNLEDDFLMLADPEKEGEVNVQLCNMSVSQSLDKEEGSDDEFKEIPFDEEEYVSDEDQDGRSDDVEYCDREYEENFFAFAGSCDGGEPSKDIGQDCGGLEGKAGVRDFLDQRVQALLELDYQPHQIGPLDGEELHGRNDWDSDLTKQVRLQKSDKHKEKWTASELIDSQDRVRPYLSKDIMYIEECDLVDAAAPCLPLDWHQQQSWISRKQPDDCVSILSYLSNTRNIPRLVEWPTDGKKVRTKVKSRCSVMNMVVEECAERRRVEVKADAPSTYRPPKETLTEKKMRKQSIRDHQRERRLEKKRTKMAYKCC